MTPLRCMLFGVLFLSAPQSVVADEQIPGRIVMSVPDAAHGRALFGAKWCVVCHSVNGIGGGAGPALDADEPSEEIDPLGFAARMWRGAGAMVALQDMELGYRIDLTGDDFADLAAFLASAEERASFSADDIVVDFRGWTIDTRLVTSDAGDGDDVSSRGYVLAERWCADCHVVRPGGDGGVAGPSFREIAGKEEASTTRVIGWLSQPHKDMPEILALEDAELEDLAAYIMSLEFE